MKIIIIRHAPVCMKWEKKYSSAGYDEAVKAYESCPILAAEAIESFSCDGRSLYVSTAKRSQETARRLFKDKAASVTPLLDEVPLRSFKDTQKAYPLWLWNGIGRLQWFIGQSRQPEGRAGTKERARELIRMLMKKGEDCILISHGWFMRTLIGELESAGFVAKRSSLFGIKPLERVILTEKALHCGNCSHNCLLTNPGCAIGKEKALSKGLVLKSDQMRLSCSTNPAASWGNRDPVLYHISDCRQ